MPITKSKEDTWKSSELHEQLKSARFKETAKDKTSMNISGQGKSSKENRSTEDDLKTKLKNEASNVHHSNDDNHASKGRDRKSKERDKIKDTNRGEDRDRERHKDRDKNREDHKHKDAHKNRDKDKDRDRLKNRDKERDIEKDKDKERQKDKQKDRDREKHRENRHKDKDGDRHRDREKHREKDKGRHRDIENDKRTEKERDKHRQINMHRDTNLEKDKEKRRDRGDDNSLRHLSSRHIEESDKKDKRKHETDEMHRYKESKQEKTNDDDDDDEDIFEYEDDFEVYEDDFEDEDVSNDNDDGDGDDDDVSDNNYQHDSKRHSSDKNKRHDDSDRDDEDNKVKVETKRQSKVHEEVKRHDGKKEGGISDLMRAMEEENERLLKRSDIFKRSHHIEDVPREKNLFSNFMINFSKEKMGRVSNRMKERAEEVLKFVELDQKIFDLFVLNPATEYEVFIQRFGNSGHTQVYVQTGDDDVDSELQTEEIVTKEVSTQQPMEFFIKKINPDDQSTTRQEVVNFTDASSLGKFLSNSAPVMIELMEESRMKTFFKSSSQKSSDVSFADAKLVFEIPEILKGRPVTFCHFSDNSQHWFLTIHAPPSKIESPEDWILRGVVCVWNISDLSSPFKILVCQADPTCCCFSPFQTSLVFAGMTDGTVLLWDLTVSSPSTMVRSDSLRGFDKLLRQSSFNNALLTATNHKSSVVSIATLDPSKIGIGEKSTNRRDDLDFQIATLEMNSVVYLWIPVDISADKGLDLDIGLSPGAKVKLIQSSIINLSSPRKSFGAPAYLSLQMTAHPSNHSHLFISTNTGRIIHAMKNRSDVHPAIYHSLIDYVSEINSMDVSIFDPPLILTGHSDGSLRLFETNSSHPIYEWADSTGYQPIIGVSWLKSRPGCFVVADDNNTIHLWDLCSNQDHPISSHNWSSKSRLSCTKTTQIETSNRSEDSTNMVVLYLLQFLGLNWIKLKKAIFTLDGCCEIHRVKDTLTKWSVKDEEKWKKIILKCSN